MDPLSFSASLIAVVGAAKAATVTLKHLITLKNAPEDIVKFSNELSDLQALLELFTHTVQSDAGLLLRSDHVDTLKQLLQRLVDILRAVASLVTQRNVSPNQPDNRTTWQQNITWTLHRARMREFLNHFRTARDNFVAAVVAYGLILTPQLYMSIQEVLESAIAMRRDIARMEQTASKGFASVRAIESRLGIECSNKEANSSALNQQSLFSDIEKSPQTRGQSTKRQSSTSGTQVTPYHQYCSLTCTCSCHKSTIFKMPALVRTLVGDLTITRSGMAFFGRSRRGCSEKLCKSQGKGQSRLTYIFPLWLLHRIIVYRDNWSPLIGHSIIVRSARAVPQSSRLFAYAQQGNIDGLRTLFSLGQASPFDVSAGSARSALNVSDIVEICLPHASFRIAIKAVEQIFFKCSFTFICSILRTNNAGLQFAVTAQQWGVCRFLISQSADAHLEDHNHLSALDCLWDWYFWRRLAGTDDVLVNTFGQDPKDLDTHRHRGFTVLHQIILGLINIGLRTQLTLSSSADINKQDTAGRSALHWAAARGDSDAVRSLLEFGASTLLRDGRGQMAVQHCAMHGTSECLGLLLQAELEEERAFHPGRSISVPPSLLEVSDYQGRSLLHLTCRSDDASKVQMLVDYGSPLEAVDLLGRTALFLAIYWNRHALIRCLLKAGARTDSITTQQETILHWAAQYADTTTLQLLTAADLTGVSAERADADGLTAREVFESSRVARRNIDGTPEIENLDTQIFNFILKTIQTDVKVDETPVTATITAVVPPDLPTWSKRLRGVRESVWWTFAMLLALMLTYVYSTRSMIIQVG